MNEQSKFNKDVRISSQLVAKNQNELSRAIQNGENVDQYIAALNTSVQQYRTATRLFEDYHLLHPHKTNPFVQLVLQTVAEVIRLLKSVHLPHHPHQDDPIVSTLNKLGYHNY